MKIFPRCFLEKILIGCPLKIRENEIRNSFSDPVNSSKDKTFQIFNFKSYDVNVTIDYNDLSNVRFL